MIRLKKNKNERNPNNIHILLANVPYEAIIPCFCLFEKLPAAPEVSFGPYASMMARNSATFVHALPTKNPSRSAIALSGLTVVAVTLPP